MNTTKENLPQQLHWTINRLEETLKSSPAFETFSYQEHPDGIVSASFSYTIRRHALGVTREQVEELLSRILIIPGYSERRNFLDTDDVINSAWTELSNAGLFRPLAAVARKYDRLLLTSNKSTHYLIELYKEHASDTATPTNVHDLKAWRDEETRCQIEWQSRNLDEYLEGCRANKIEPGCLDYLRFDSCLG